MAWKKSPKELTDLLEKSLREIECEKRRMFGFPAYFINRNMFTGTFEEHLFLRLSRDDREDIKGNYKEAKSFEPMKGRAMKEYVVLPKSIYDNDKEFMQWIRRSIAYVGSLPVKKKK